MKGLKFKALAALIAAAYCLMYIPVFAYDLPNAFWSLNDSYSAAQNSKDYSGIAYYGSRVIDLISAEPSNEQTDNIMGSRTYDTAFAYFFAMIMRMQQNILICIFHTGRKWAGATE